MSNRLHESGALIESSGVDGVFPIRIISEGVGSSGVYSKELLKEYKDVFAKRPMFMNHPKDADKPWERDILTAAGKLSENVEYREVDGVAGLYATATVRKEFREFIEEFRDVIGVSVYIEGEGRSENGKYVVESFNGDDPYSSVDFVVAAGRGGRVERAMESLRVIESSVGNPAGTDDATARSEEEKRKKQNMDELKALIEALSSKVDAKFVALEAKVDSVVTLSEQATAAAADKVEAFEVADELSKAVAEAKLPEEGRKRALEAVRDGGKTVAEAVASEKAYIKSIAESMAPAAPTVGAGRVVEGAEPAGFSLSKLAEVK